jgi:hypothetical protein
MFEQLKKINRRPGQVLLAALLTLISTITGCDKKVDWRGVSTDSRDRGQETSTDAPPGEPADEQSR